MADENLDASTTTTEGTTIAEATAPVETPVETSTATEVTSPPATNGDNTFFDPSAVPEELMPAYKNMQGQFTKKMQGLSDSRQKGEAYDQLFANPEQSLRQLAQQYNVNLGNQQPAPVVPEAQENWEPKSWNELLDRADARAEERIMQKLAPVINPMMEELKTVKKSETERKLDAAWPEWRQYETEMVDVLKKHPTLADDPVTLAELATPNDIKESKAYKKALNTLNKKVDSSKVVTSPGVKADTNTAKRPMSFHESYIQAKRQIG